ARLYHNVALLMPDARIFVAGGNTSRATVFARPTPHPQKTFPSGQPKPDLSAVDVDMYFYGDGPMGKFEKGSLQVPTETWTAEMFSPPYLFIDPGRRASIASIEPAGTVPYQSKATLQGKTYYLVHSGDSFDVKLDGLPECNAANGLLSLIKLPAPSHGWDSGQLMIAVPFQVTGPGRIRFRTPDMRTANAPPAFYMMFYMDCRGKPTVAQMVRFDDTAKSPLD
ncbi:MAG TPA: galactose oxidase-like domain-containing protein, partial [Thermoanaerobaculia bacterium]|nr:galactose oxidase-like domain-containing protein [Thermoanaerobaculia bacterium]